MTPPSSARPEVVPEAAREGNEKLTAAPKTEPRKQSFDVRGWLASNSIRLREPSAVNPELATPGPERPLDVSRDVSLAEPLDSPSTDPSPPVPRATLMPPRKPSLETTRPTVAIADATKSLPTKRAESLEGPLLWDDEDTAEPASQPKLAESDKLSDAAATAASNLAAIHDVAKAPSDKSPVAATPSAVESVWLAGAQSPRLPVQSSVAPQPPEAAAEFPVHDAGEAPLLTTPLPLAPAYSEAEIEQATEASWPEVLRPAIAALKEKLPKKVEIGEWSGGTKQGDRLLDLYSKSNTQDRRMPIDRTDLADELIKQQYPKSEHAEVMRRWDELNAQAQAFVQGQPLPPLTEPSADESGTALPSTPEPSVSVSPLPATSSTERLSPNSSWPAQLLPMIQDLQQFLPTGITIGPWQPNSPTGDILSLYKQGVQTPLSEIQLQAAWVGATTMDREDREHGSLLYARLKAQAKALASGSDLPVYSAAPVPEKRAPATPAVQTAHRVVELKDMAKPAETPAVPATGTELPTDVPEVVPVSAARQQLDADIKRLQEFAPGLVVQDPATTEPDAKGKRHATLTMSWKHPQTGEVVEIKKPEDFRNPPFTLKSVDDLPVHASQDAQAVFERLYTKSLPAWGAEDAARKDQEAAQSAPATAQAAPAVQPSLLNRIFGFFRKK